MAGAGAGAVQGPESRGRKRSLFTASGGGAPAGASPASSSSAAAAASGTSAKPINALDVLRDGARNMRNPEYDEFVRRTTKDTPGKAPRANRDVVVGCRTIGYTPDNFEDSIVSIANMLVGRSRRPKRDCQILIGYSGSKAGAELRIACHTHGSANLGAAFKGDCTIPINVGTFSAILELRTCPPGVLLETTGYNILSAVGFHMWNREHALERNAKSCAGCSVYLILLETSTPRGINPWTKVEGKHIKKVRKPPKPYKSRKKETKPRKKRTKKHTTDFSQFTVTLHPGATENLGLPKIERQVAVRFGILCNKDRAVASKWWGQIKPLLKCSLSEFEARCANLIADNQELGVLRNNGEASGEKITLLGMWKKCKKKFG